MVPRKSRKVVIAKVTDTEKRRYPSKHYVYIIRVTWDDGNNTTIFRRYSHFFDFQIDLLESFPLEGGIKDPSVRVIPFLPGKILFRRSQIRDVAIKRLKSLDEYVNSLLQLPSHISQSEQVLNFFESKQEDLHPPQEELNKKKKGGEKYISEISAPIVLEQYTAISDYTRTQPNELTVATGQTLEVIEKNENGWWFVNDEEGERGWVPGVYLEKCDGTSENLVTKQSELGEGEKYVTTAQFSGGREEVSFGIGVLVEVLQKNLEGWWYISYQDKQGWAPASYLEKPAEAVLRQTDATRLAPPSTSATENRRSLPSDAANTILPLSDDVCDVATSTVLSRKKNSLTRTNSNPLSASSRKKTTVAASPLSLPSSSLVHPPPKRSTIKRMPSALKPLVPPPLPPTLPNKEEPVYEYYTASSFDADIPHGISFQVDEKVKVLEKSPGGWWYITMDGKEGWAPASHITKVFSDDKSHELSMKPKPPSVPDKPSPVHCKSGISTKSGNGSPSITNKSLESTAGSISSHEFNFKNSLKSAVAGKDNRQQEQKVGPPLPPAKPGVGLAKSNLKFPVSNHAIEGKTFGKQPLEAKCSQSRGNEAASQFVNSTSSPTPEPKQVDLRSVLKPVSRKPTEAIAKDKESVGKRPPVLPKKPMLPSKPSATTSVGLSTFSSLVLTTNSIAGKPNIPPVKPAVVKAKSKPVLRRFQPDRNFLNRNGNNNTEEGKNVITTPAKTNQTVQSKYRKSPDGKVANPILPSNNNSGEHGRNLLNGQSCGITKFVAMRAFEPANTNEMGFLKGNEATLLERSESHWWYMQINGKCGWVPSSYFEPMSDSCGDENEFAKKEQMKENLYVDEQFMSINSAASSSSTAAVADNSEALYSEVVEPSYAEAEPQSQVLRAKSNFIATDDTMVNLAPGDLVEVMEQTATGWFYVKIFSSSGDADHKGWVPADSLTEP